jgi:transposase
MSRKTIRKTLAFPVPPGYRRRKVMNRPKLGPYLEVIDQIVKQDAGQPEEQRHTARWIWEWLKERHGFTGGFTIVRDYVQQTRCPVDGGSKNDPLLPTLHQPAFESEDPAQLTYELIQSTPKEEAVRLLRVLFGSDPSPFDWEQLKQSLTPFAPKDTREIARLQARQSAFDWMRQVLQGEISLPALTKEVGELPDLQQLLTAATQGRLSVRNRALAVLARAKGISCAHICGFLHIDKATLLKYCRRYQQGSLQLLMARKFRSTTKFDKDPNKKAVFSLLHTPPSVYGINRTTWRMADLEEVLQRQGTPLGKEVIAKIIEEAGYKWRRARVVLTSKDPEYRTKLEGVQKILSELAPDEAFFSIDEYGPFAVKQKGGVKRVAPGQEYVVPQWQKSKGWMILTAALEAIQKSSDSFLLLPKEHGRNDQNGGSPACPVSHLQNDLFILGCGFLAHLKKVACPVGKIKSGSSSRRLSRGKNCTSTGWRSIPERD